MANDRVEIYFFNDYYINIVQTIFFFPSVPNSFVMGERVGQFIRQQGDEKRSTCGDRSAPLGTPLGRDGDGK